MNDILGVPMDSLMILLLLLLTFCLLMVVWVAWRRPVIFKLGVRNIPRRKPQTALIVVGLMLSTLIISAALGTGDTINHSMTSDIYANLGHVDEVIIGHHDVVAQSDLTASVPLDTASLALVDGIMATNRDIDGVMPVLEARVPVVNNGRQLAEPDVILTGLDPARIDAFGGLKTTRGQVIDLATLAADEIVVSAKLASDIDAREGDSLTIFVDSAPHTVTVAAVAEDTYLSGTRRSRGTDLEYAGMTMALSRMQELTGNHGTFTSILVSNTGGERDGMDLSDPVAQSLRRALDGHGLGVDSIKQDRVEYGEGIAKTFTTFFVIVGLFSVASGILLIVLIFTMLASERRAEMGMARAVGAHRSQLMQQFVSEGAGYAIAAGMVGAALGVGTTFGIAAGMKAIFGRYVPIEAHVESRSMLVAYCLGVVITFLTVAFTSWKISRINIVAAIRDLVEESSPKRKKSTLVWSGLLLLGGGLLAYMGGSSGSEMPFTTGMSILPFGVALLLCYFGVPGRLAFSAVGVYILAFWLMPNTLFTSIFGEYDGGIETFFVAGIFLVIAATILIVQNMDVLLKAITAAGGLFRTKLPAARTAVAYPAAARSRTGMTIAMFSLIIFSLVMMASMNQTYTEMALGDSSNAGWDVRADTRSSNAEPIGDFDAALAAAGVDVTRFDALATVTNPSEHVSAARVQGEAEDDWKEYPVYGMDDSFIVNSKLEFQQRAEGYATDADVIAALRAQSNLAVIDTVALESDGIGGDEDALIISDLSSDDTTFAPRQIEIADPRSGLPHTITIIGVIDQKIGSLYGLYTNQATVDEIYGGTTLTSYFVSLTDSSQSSAVAKDIESALLSNGVQGTSIRDELKDMQKQESGFLYIIEGFMGLGLLVGVSAIGVIAFRSVVERRQQIGVLRALGWRRELVSLSFMIETAFVVGVGMFTGTALGLRLASNLVASGELGSTDVSFVIPWPTLLVILGSTFAVALLMTWVPARQAGRIAPAEALRYE